MGLGLILQGGRQKGNRQLEDTDMDTKTENMTHTVVARSEPQTANRNYTISNRFYILRRAQAATCI